MTFGLDKIVVMAGQGKQGEAFRSLGYITTDDTVDVVTEGYSNINEKWSSGIILGW